MPTGTVGNSGNANMGIHVNNPNARLDVQTNTTFGALQLRTAAELVAVMGGGTTYITSPFALKVLHSDNGVTNTTALLTSDGKKYLGSFNNYPASHYLNTLADGIGIYKNNNADNEKLSISYNSDYGYNLSWQTNQIQNHLRNFGISYNNGAPLFSITPEGLTSLNLTGSDNNKYALSVNTGVGNVFRLSESGSVYIGENLNGAYFDEYRLYVQHGIRTERVRVDVSTDNGWADFVFEDDYELMPISELEAFIKEHKHLPNVPSAAQVQAEGIDLAEINAILLRQIEELTLRVIALEKKTTK